MCTESQPSSPGRRCGSSAGSAGKPACRVAQASSSATPQHPLQAVIVNVQHSIKNPLGCSGEPARISLMTDRLQESAAKHWSEGQRHNAGNENCRRNRDGEFTEEPAQNATHE